MTPSPRASRLVLVAHDPNGDAARRAVAAFERLGFEAVAVTANGIGASLDGVAAVVALDDPSREHVATAARHEPKVRCLVDVARPHDFEGSSGEALHGALRIAGTIGDILTPSSSARGSAPSPASPAPNRRTETTVVIAVYNAVDEVIRCVESVLAHTPPPFRVLLVDDGSPDPTVAPTLRRYVDAHGDRVDLISRRENRGYTYTINEGCRHVAGDVVLLNSDTEVTDGWIEKLSRLANSRDDIATVTPVSNAAGAFSVPEGNRNEELPEGFDTETVGRLVERLSYRTRPEVPTGNGFCMYITRRAFDAVGYFDSLSFPRGYGEENDFCMRASAAGLVHLIDDTTFVYHQRSASFGSEKAALVQNARAVLQRLHPTYKQRVTAFLGATGLEDLGADLREVYDGGPAATERVLGRRPRLLMVLHAGSGGTPQTNADLVSSLANRFDCLVLSCGLQEWSLSDAASGQEVGRWELAEPWDPTAERDDERWSLIAGIVRDRQIDLVHVRSLVGLAPEVLPHIKGLGVPLVVSFHDFFTVCPTIQLLDQDRHYCAGHCTPGPGRCSLAATWFRKPLPPLKHEYVHVWQDRMGRGLRAADAFITTSEASRAVIEDHFPEATARLTVIDHGRDFAPTAFVSPRPEPEERQRILAHGALGWSKGIELIDQLLRIDAERGSRFEFHLLGALHGSWRPEELGAVVHGPYVREELDERIAAIAPHYAMVASIWPETYCHALTEAWNAGLPTFVSDIGTLRERSLKHGGAWLIDPLDAERCYERMIAVADDPQQWDDRRREIERIPIRRVDHMSGPYRRIYLDLLDRAGVGESESP